MQYKDLSETMKRAYDSLSTDKEKAQFLEEQENLHKQAIRGAFVQVQARNNSHNIGNHVANAKKK